MRPFERRRVARAKWCMRDAGYRCYQYRRYLGGWKDAQGNIQTVQGAGGLCPQQRAEARHLFFAGSEDVRQVRREPGAMKSRMSYVCRLGDRLLWKYDLCGLREQMKEAPGSRAQDHDGCLHQDAGCAATHGEAYCLQPLPVWERCCVALGALRSAEISGERRGYQRQVYSSMAQIGFSQAGLAPFAGPGHWNDPDMLEVGNGGRKKTEEYRTHSRNSWAILAALLAGNDLSTMTPGTVALLTNRDVIAIDQDKAGKQGDRSVDGRAY